MPNTQNDKELLKQLVKKGENLRQAQKGYFKEKDPVKKKELLGAARSAETEFDAWLITVKRLIQ